MSQLPLSVQPGKPLPTVEEPQSHNLPAKGYQSIAQSAVLSESLSRSRQKWIDGLFEKYWVKPSKRKGAIEDPKNPSKDSMQKIGLVTITVEPHVFEATIYTVKEPLPPPPDPTSRPFLQYGPPNGTMPPPSAPKSATPVASTAPVTPNLEATVPSQQSDTKAENPILPPENSQTKVKPEPQDLPSQTTTATVSSTQNTQIAKDVPAASSVELEKPNVPLQCGPQSSWPVTPAPLTAASQSPAPATQSSAVRPSTSSIQSSSGTATSQVTSASKNSSAGPMAPASVGGAPQREATGTNTAVTGQASPDPVIVTLAEKAGHDPSLRDLMKRVASGMAQKEELALFQRIIDQITAGHKNKGTQQGPSADRLLVDGRTVKYFADEVNTIVGIVLRTNPKQKGSSLKIPPGLDRLIGALVIKALDDGVTKDKIQRVAEGKPQFSDATDLKAILDSLKDSITKPKSTPASRNTHSATASTSQSPRSKGPVTPSIKRDISAVVFEFAGGTGDRYLFPKFAILDPQNYGQQLVASFLIVRKGSTSEYGGDPTLDYYQPVTIRIFAHSAKQLEALQKVVAPREEVQRYMEDVMDNMTRAEYVLLAMRLPREVKKEEQNGTKETTPTSAHGNSGVQTSQAPKNEATLVPGGPAILHHTTNPPAVLWKATPPPLRPSPVVRRAINAVGADDDYQQFVSTVMPKKSEVT